eukprot:SAG31_NODE_966_length_10688_cov_8.343564_11_plen_121_part_00
MGCATSTVSEFIPLGTIVQVVGAHRHQGRVGTVQKEGAKTTKIICFDRLDINSEVLTVPTAALVAQSPAGGHQEEEAEPEPDPEPQSSKPKRRIKTNKVRRLPLQQILAIDRMSTVLNYI